jgi:hypothetical protein
MISSATLEETRESEGPFEGAGVGVLEHLDEHTQLDPVGMGLDGDRFPGMFFTGPLVDDGLAIGGRVFNGSVRVGDRGLLDVVVDGAAASLVGAGQLDLHPRTMVQVPGRELFVLDDLGRIKPGVDVHFVVMSGLSLTGARPDADRLTGGELAVHGGGRDADALLPTALFQGVEFGAVEELREDLRNLRLDDAGAIVLNGDPKTIFRQGLDAYLELGKDSGIFTGVERVVHAFLDRGQQGFLWIIEPQKVPVPSEELRDRDLALLGRQALGGNPGPAGRL